MLGMTNKKKTAMGGIGIAVLLTLLMALTPMSGLVGNPIDDSAMVAEHNQVAEEDAFVQPEKLEPMDYGFADSSEVMGARDANMKTFRNADGTFTQMISDQPIHYDNDGTWSDIDLNLKATAFGWEVVENTFNTAFSAEVANGVVIQPSEWDDAILTGLNPMLVVMDESGTSHTPFEAPPATSEVTVGGNTIRYPLAEGFDLDYEVNTFQVKQNLVIRERPILDEGAHWFGFTEAMRLPAGHALYSGEVMVESDLVQTDGHLEIRNVETGDLYAEIPAPMVIEPGVEEPYFGTFFVMTQGPVVFLTTAVETSWLLDDERVFPLGLDPTLSVTSAGGGYCFVSSNNCYNSNYRYTYHNSVSGKSSSSFRPYYYYTPWHKFTFTSSNALPTGASLDKIEYKEYVSYHNSYLSNSKIDYEAKVMEDCGTTRPSYTTSSGSTVNPTSGYYYYQTYYGNAITALMQRCHQHLVPHQRVRWKRSAGDDHLCRALSWCCVLRERPRHRLEDRGLLRLDRHHVMLVVDAGRLHLVRAQRYVERWHGQELRQLRHRDHGYQLQHPAVRVHLCVHQRFVEQLPRPDLLGRYGFRRTHGHVRCLRRHHVLH